MDGSQALAKRYIKGLIRVHLCEARLAEAHPGESVWSHAAWIAGSFAQDAQEAWFEHVRGKDFDRLKPCILRALQEAADDATLPYEETLSKEWMAEHIREFLDKFDTEMLRPAEGEA